jgi:hypothetical protein
MPRPIHASRFLQAALLVLLFLSGCAHAGVEKSARAEKPFIRSIRFEGAETNPELAEAARKFGEAEYPAILALVGDAASPRQIDIVFQTNLLRRFKTSIRRAGRNLPPQLSAHPAGVARGTVVYLSLEDQFRSPAKMRNTLAHELAHCAQHYSAFGARRRPGYWTEAIADYTAQKITAPQNPAEPPCRCTGLWPHYTYGYVCGAAFLSYIEQHGHTNIVTSLNTTLRKATYSDAFFLNATGKSLEEWWREFLAKGHVTNLARSVNEIFTEIGFRDGKLPKDAESRLRDFIARQLEPAHLLDILGMSGHANERPEDIRLRVFLLAASLAEPGETAMDYVSKLWKSGALPGFPEAGAGSIYEPIDLGAMDDLVESDAREIVGVKPGESRIYHYQVIRPCRECGRWEIEKAWLATRDGQIVERLNVP